MSTPLETHVRLWERHAGNLQDFDEDLEVTTVLVDRDTIEERFRELTPAQLTRVTAADQALMTNAHRIAARWPQLIVASRPAERWWWHLDRVRAGKLRQAS